MNNCNNFNYLDSAHYLGKMYYYGYFVKQNNKKALELFKKNSNDIIENIYYLIKLYYKFENYNKILELLKNNNIKKINNKLISECYYIIANIYFNNNYLNIRLGKEFLEKSLQFNNNDAYYLYAKYHEYGIKYIKNLNIAFKNYMIAANNNHMDSISKIAYFYYNGLYLKEDKQLALHIWKKLSNQNNDFAIFSLSEHYKNIDEEKFLFYIKKSIKLNNTNAMYNLANYYKNINNKDEYIYYLELSSKNNKNAKNELDDYNKLEYLKNT